MDKFLAHKTRKPLTDAGDIGNTVDEDVQILLDDMMTPEKRSQPSERSRSVAAGDGACSTPPAVTSLATPSAPMSAGTLPPSSKRRRITESEEKRRAARETEKERARLEREQQKADEKAAREAERQRLKEEKDRERREKEEEKERQRHEKEEAIKRQRREREQAAALAKEAKRQEIEAERLRKEAEREQEKRRQQEAKEEVRRLKEEQKADEDAARLRAEAELREKMSITKYLNNSINCDPSARRTAAVGNAAPSTSRFGEFVLKDGYVLAPLTRRPPFDDQSKRALELLICDQENTQVGEHLYLPTLKQRLPLTYARTPAARADGDDGEVEEESLHRMKVKLIQFADSYRPPYYGTYRRRGRPAVTGRRPFATHTLIDYDVDSDAEWEEEPTDADECVESEKSDDEDADAIDDEDNIDPDTGKPFFVPHGYLSGSEGEQGDEDENTPVADGEERRARLAAMAEAWKTTKMFADKASARLHPLVIGPYWPGLDGQQPCDAPLLDTLTRCRGYAIGSPMTSYNYIAPDVYENGSIDGSNENDASDTAMIPMN